MSKPDNPIIVNEKAIHDCIDPFVDLCEVITYEHPSGDAESDGLTKIMEGTLMKNVKRIRAIHLLIDENHELAGTALEIMRNMLEDAVSVEYLLLADVNDDELDLKVERFFDFQWIQLQQDLNYYREIGIPTRADFPQKIAEIEARSAERIQKYSAEKRRFKDGDQLAHSWLRKGVEQLLAEIKAAELNDGGKTDFIARAYIRGNRSTHFNPQSVLEELQLEYDKFHGRSHTIDAYEAFIIGGLCVVWILRAYLDGVPPSETWGDFDKLDNKVNDVENYLLTCVANITQLPHDHAR